MTYASSCALAGDMAHASYDDVVREIERLTKRCCVTDSVEALVQLRDFRVTGGLALLSNRRGASNAPCPPIAADPFPLLPLGALPEIPASELSLEILAGAILHHGSLIVRGFAEAGLAEGFRHQIDRVFVAAHEFLALGEGTDTEGVKSESETDRRWFSLSEDIALHLAHRQIGFLRQTGSIFTHLSPTMSHALSAFFADRNLKPLLTSYFGDAPCTSLRKSVLRCAEPPERQADWHQDGAFMTADIKSLNLWLALSECGDGTTRPGIDIVPRRLTGIIPTGTNGAFFEWSVSRKTIDERFEQSPPVRPHFEEGDAVFFDHLNLHATSYDPAFTEPRYAIETWFFASSCHAANQLPVLW